MKMSEWFERVWRKPGEGKTQAVTRLASETGIAYPTVYRVIGDTRLTPETVEKLRPLVADHVDCNALTLLPTRESKRTGTAG